MVPHRPDTEARLRWSGHRLLAEINLAVNPNRSVTEGHAIAVEARHQLLHGLPYLSNVTVHIDPEDLSGEKHHGIPEHTHGNLANHSHRKTKLPLEILEWAIIFLIAVSSALEFIQ